MKNHALPIAAWGLAYYLALCLVDLALFLVAHLPGATNHFDGLLLGLTDLRLLLVWPKTALRALWWGETTPPLLTYLTTVLNVALWGTAIHFTRKTWKRVRQNR